MTRSLVAAALLLSATTLATAQDPATIKAFSKYDFVPGTQIVAFEDFGDDAVGDFPDGWDTNASGEIVTIEGRQGHWLMFTKGGIFLPGLADVLPDNFTLEFDLAASTPFTSGQGFSIVFAELATVRQPATWQAADNRYTVTVHPSGQTSSERRQEGVGEPEIGRAHV